MCRMKSGRGRVVDGVMTKDDNEGPLAKTRIIMMTDDIPRTVDVCIVCNDQASIRTTRSGYVSSQALIPPSSMTAMDTSCGIPAASRAA